jgi:hypothetical protein
VHCTGDWLDWLVCAPLNNVSLTERERSLIERSRD